jgi:hypothetical protein
MSIPIIMLLQFVIDEYASKQPGSKSPESEVPATNSSEADDVPRSDFGKLIIGGAVGDVCTTSSADTALLVYAGKADTIMISAFLFSISVVLRLRLDR